MSAGDRIKINEWLSPLSTVYGAAVRSRNWLFDVGVLRQKGFSVPVIAVGNLTVGGCGKTPHTEYLIRLLRDDYRVAVLSRGYKRKKRGHIVATAATPMNHIGDEPYQMKEKFPEVYVAVNKDRVNGIKRLLSNPATRDTDVVLLDDAYQHRYVRPRVNILLVDYHRLITYDELLPAGRLREPFTGRRRADVVIVTKCPSDLREVDYTVVRKMLQLESRQKIFFTTIDYMPLRQFVTGEERSLADLAQENILLVSGIASPEQIKGDLARYCPHITTLPFGDHHQFDERDLRRIGAFFTSMDGPRIIVTTEKDAARLRAMSLPRVISDSLYVLPIEVKFLRGGQEPFDRLILNSVRR